jgi:hypothetical protein
MVDELRVRWPSGAEQLVTDVDVDQLLVLTEPSASSG